jgi:uncharacterized membrane protein
MDAPMGEPIRSIGAFAGGMTASTGVASAKPRPAIVRIVWVVTVLLAVIGVATVTRRTVQIFAPSPAPSNFPEAAAMDSGFARHPLLTMAHIIPGLLFMVLGPLQFVRRLRNRRPELHRWMGRVVLGSGMVIGITALVMSPQMAIGGANETAATMFFAVVFVFALVKAFLSIRRGNVALHREWMIRAFAVGLAVATVRPIVGAFFATRSLTHLTPHEFFGTAFWLGFTTHLVVAEIWINYTRPGIAAEGRMRQVARG